MTVLLNSGLFGLSKDILDSVIPILPINPCFVFLRLKLGQSIQLVHHLNISCFIQLNLLNFRRLTLSHTHLIFLRHNLPHLSTKGVKGYEDKLIQLTLFNYTLLYIKPIIKSTAKFLNDFNRLQPGENCNPKKCRCLNLSKFPNKRIAQNPKPSPTAKAVCVLEAI